MQGSLRAFPLISVSHNISQMARVCVFHNNNESRRSAVRRLWSPVTRQTLVSGTGSETGHRWRLGCPPRALISNCIYLASVFPPLRAVMRRVVSWGVCCWWWSEGFFTDSCWLGVKRSPADLFDSCDPLQAGPTPGQRRALLTGHIIISLIQDIKPLSHK